MNNSKPDVRNQGDNRIQLHYLEMVLTEETSTYLGRQILEVWWFIEAFILLF